MCRLLYTAIVKQHEYAIYPKRNLITLTAGFILIEYSLPSFIGIKF